MRRWEDRLRRTWVKRYSSSWTESIINFAIRSQACILRRNSSLSASSIKERCLKYLQLASSSGVRSCVQKRTREVTLGRYFRHASNAKMTQAFSSPPASHTNPMTLEVIIRECGLVNQLTYHYHNYSAQGDIL